MKKLRLVGLVLLVVCFSFIWTAGVFHTDVVSTSTVPEIADDCPSAAASADLFDEIAQLLWPKPQRKELGKVILGGVPIGLALEDKGVQIVGFSEIATEEGKICPATVSGLKIGDRIVSINGTKVTSISELSRYAEKSNGTALEIEFIRNNKTESASIVPVKDGLTKTFRLGVLAKESYNGVGTLTFMREDMTFASLGHPMTNDEHEIIEIDGGNVFNCRILDVKKGVKGASGELKGIFTGKQPIGVIKKNNKFGVYGQYSAAPKNVSINKLVDVACRADVRPGKAQIVSTIDGEYPAVYDIEIVKVINQTEKDDRGLVIHVTDKSLLQKTGGIVQGMSGSPIIQNGKLIGAVTHVFINDPTRGFGMFAEWMMSE